MGMMRVRQLVCGLPDHLLWVGLKRMGMVMMLGVVGKAFGRGVLVLIYLGGRRLSARRRRSRLWPAVGFCRGRRVRSRSSSTHYERPTWEISFS
jgi:hypothetical protein